MTGRQGGANEADQILPLNHSSSSSLPDRLACQTAAQSSARMTGVDRGDGGAVVAFERAVFFFGSDLTCLEVLLGFFRRMVFRAGDFFALDLSLGEGLMV